MESNIETIKALFDVGGVVVVTVMLWIVWRRMNDVTDKLIDILTELRLQSLSSSAGRNRKDNEA
jgi:hypothetical protein